MGDSTPTEAEKWKLHLIRRWSLGIGIKSASLVTGPQGCTIPPEPVWRRFEDGREVLAAGTIFWDETEPVLHIHSAVGKGDLSLTGCMRQETEAYLVVEVIIQEINGIDATRALDPAMGIKALML